MKCFLIVLAAFGFVPLVLIYAGTAGAASVSGTAGGQVTFDAPAGTVRAEATGLTQNFGGFAYVGWLVNEATGEKLNTGLLSNSRNSFGTSNLGSAGFTLYVITFERASNTSNTPEGLPVATAKAVLPRGASPLQPTIGGTVDVTDTTVMARLSGLPALPSGFEYVGWLVNEATDRKLNTGVLGAGGVNNFTGTALGAGGFTAYVVTYEPVGNRTNNPAGMPVAKGSISLGATSVMTPPRTGDAGLAADSGTGFAPWRDALLVAGLLLVGGVAGTVALARRRA